MITQVNSNNKKDKEQLHKICFHQHSFFPLWRIYFGEQWVRHRIGKKGKPYETIVPFMHSPSPKTNQEQIWIQRQKQLMAFKDVNIYIRDPHSYCIFILQ